MFECHSPSTRVAYNPGKRGRTGRVWQLRGSQLFLHTWYQCCHTTATRQAACLSPHMMRMISIEICSLPCMCNVSLCINDSCARSEKRRGQKKPKHQKGTWRKSWTAQPSTEPFNVQIAKMLFPDKRYCSIDRAGHLGRWIAKWGWGPGPKQCELQ